MYAIIIQNHIRTPLCYFDNYKVAKECFNKLVDKYPDGIIELGKISATSCIEEFEDSGYMNIKHYE
jgi:hypothetical protein